MFAWTVISVYCNECICPFNTIQSHIIHQHKFSWKCCSFNWIKSSVWPKKRQLNDHTKLENLNHNIFILWFILVRQVWLTVTRKKNTHCINQLSIKKASTIMSILQSTSSTQSKGFVLFKNVVAWNAPKHFETGFVGTILIQQIKNSIVIKIDLYVFNCIWTAFLISCAIDSI